MYYFRLHCGSAWGTLPLPRRACPREEPVPAEAGTGGGNLSYNDWTPVPCFRRVRFRRVRLREDDRLYESDKLAGGDNLKIMFS